MAAPSTSLDACYQAGVEAWPEFAVPRDEFDALVATRQGGADGVALDAAELYLACGCALGDSTALRAFDRDVANGIPATLRRMKLDDAASADVLQQLRIRLFTAADNEPPRIVAYAGTGKLRALVQVAATRLALDAQRSRRRIDPAPAEDHLANTAALTGDAMTLLNKAELRHALRQAFEQAATQLARRDRTLLRMSVLDGLTIDELASMYRVHRATVARWLVAAREQLTAEARRRFAALSGLEGTELTHAGELVESQLSVSLERLLRSHV